MNKDRGITLIALVVTIVVLLILVGVSISTLTGENGIITQAQNAKLETRGGEVEENVMLWKIEHEMKDYSKADVLTEDEFITDLKNKKLVFDEEINTETKIITIGSREIYYGIDEDVELINFTLFGEQCQAEEGMTWIEWILSSYCSKEPEDFYIDESGEYSKNVYVTYSIGYICFEEEYGTMQSSVFYESIIKEGATYVYDQPECVFPDSEILVSLEGQTILAEDMKEGNNIVYYNFQTEKSELGKVSKVYVHKDATNFVRYEFSDGTYLEATDYHPIYTEEGWKSLTRRNGYEVPEIGDKVKTQTGWKELTNIETWQGLEDCYDFVITTEEGKTINNYYANGTLVQGSY